MTEMRKGDGIPDVADPTRTVLVRDPLVRSFHWALVPAGGLAPVVWRGLFALCNRSGSSRHADEKLTQVFRGDQDHVSRAPQTCSIRQPRLRSIAMKTILSAAALALAIPPAAAIAGDDCHVLRGAWQPREAAMQAAAGLGWRVETIESDDGCWEVKGRDALGRRIKAKLDPATLQVVKPHHPDGEHDREHSRDRAPADARAAPPANPLFQNGAPPMVRVN